MASTKAAIVAVLVGIACSGSTPKIEPGQTGAACTASSQCFSDVDAAALKGTATCLTQLAGGYCTHTCTTNADCCATPNECKSGFKEICASFESSGQTYCFLSCAAADIASDPNAGTTDAAAFCQKWAGSTFTCRSTGGGRNNQQFCGP